ncbi:MAG: hypothetical protein IJ593_05690 [Lachnospiraceae bacterium]|nr:hypothetical protein [Lachnospiraceae bacterium]
MANKILNIFKNNRFTKLPKFLSILVLLFITGYTVINIVNTYSLGQYKTIYVCPSCGETSDKKSDIYKEQRGVYVCKHCGYTAYTPNVFYAQEDRETGDITTYDEAQEQGGGFFDILKNIGKFIFSAILALIGSLLWGIASAAYGLLGNEYISNFINFSLNFESIGGSVSSIVGSVSSLLSGLAFSLIVLFVLRNILLNYILWRGNPNENPLEVIIGIAMCVAMIAGFSDIYAGISGILGNIINSIGGGSANFTEIPNQLVYSAIGERITENTVDFFITMADDPSKFAKQVFALIISLMLFFKLLQALISAAKSGIELLALKVAAPLFCLSLLNNNISGFGSYLKEIIKRFFGIMLKVAAINISLSLLSNVGGGTSFLFTVCGIFAGIAVIENSGQFLSGIISSAGGGNELASSGRSISGGINAGLAFGGQIKNLMK